MRLRILLSLSALAPVLALSSAAQPADDFFHGGAQLYISNNIPVALERVESGLKLYPDDVKLKKLEELLNRRQQQQQQQQDQQQKDQQSQKQEQSKQQDQKQQNDQNKKQDQEKEKTQQQKSSAQEKKDQQEESDQAKAMEAHAMTPQEAQQMLDAQKGDETVLPLSLPAKPENRQHPIKDW